MKREGRLWVHPTDFLGWVCKLTSPPIPPPSPSHSSLLSSFFSYHTSKPKILYYIPLSTQITRLGRFFLRCQTSPTQALMLCMIKPDPSWATRLWLCTQRKGKKPIDPPPATAERPPWLVAWLGAETHVRGSGGCQTAKMGWV